MENCFVVLGLGRLIIIVLPMSYTQCNAKPTARTGLSRVNRFIQAKSRASVMSVLERVMCAVFMSRFPSVYSTATVENRAHIHQRGTSFPRECPIGDNHERRTVQSPALNQIFSLIVYNRTFTSTQGSVHSRRPNRLRSHSKPTPVHSSGLDSTPSFCCALSSAAPANAFAVELNVSKTKPARLSPGKGASTVALPERKLSAGAEL